MALLYGFLAFRLLGGSSFAKRKVGTFVFNQVSCVEQLGRVCFVWEGSGVFHLKHSKFDLCSFKTCFALLVKRVFRIHCIIEILCHHS